ncbi:MAG: hypothetical protein HOY69_10940 [Streptomyces sp.]|nr:hypothetical protein [Streptomyces sp.]
MSESAAPHGLTHTHTYTGRSVGGGPLHVTVAAGAALGAVLLLYVLALAIAAHRRRRVLRHGVTAHAVIEAITAHRVVARGEAVRAALALTVMPPDGPDYAAVATAVFPTDDLPEPGWTVLVRYWPSAPHRLAVDLAATPL